MGDTDEAGRAGAEKLLWYLSHNKVPTHFKNPPGYLAVPAAVGALRSGKVGSRQEGYVPTLDEQIAKGTVFCGSPDTVYKQLKKFYDHVGGFGNLISMGQAGFLTHEETVTSMKLLANEVMPRLCELSPQRAAA